MRILFLSAASNIHTVRWVNALVNKGHEVHLVFQENHKPSDNKISDSVVLHSLKYSNTKGYFLNALQLNKIFKQIDPDIVNVHYASGYGTLARIAKLKPLVLSVWGSDVYDFPYESRLKMKLLKKNLLYADKIASTSYCMANQVRKLLDNDTLEIEVTPFGVDTKKFLRKMKYEDKAKICIGNIKTLAPKYGISDLVKAIKILKESLEKKGFENISNNIVVHIYGDGEQKSEIIELIETLQLTKTVELKGKIPNSSVPNALEEFDIFCATSILDSESFGVSAVEAMAMELPVVATDVDGFKEVVEDGNTGIIVERKNPVAIAKALEKLVLDKKLRVKMGKKGRERVLKLYDWDSNVDIMVNLYNKCTYKK